MFNRESLTDVSLVLQAPLDISALGIQRGMELLSASEQLQAKRYRLDSRQRAFIVGRATARILLGSFFGIPPRDVSLGYSASGKPQFNDLASFPINFSISHSRNWLLVGFTLQSEIGVDIEEFDPSVEIALLMRNYFLASEQRAWADVHTEQRQATFFRFWTCKEAAWKFFGDPMLKWSEFEVILDDDKHSTIRATQQDPGKRHELDGFSWSSGTWFASVVTANAAARVGVVSMEKEWLEQLLIGEIESDDLQLALRCYDYGSRGIEKSDCQTLL